MGTAGKAALVAAGALAAVVIGASGSAAQEREAPPPPVMILRPASVLIRAQPTPEPTPTPSPSPSPTPSPTPAPVRTAAPVLRPVFVRPIQLRPVAVRPIAQREPAVRQSEIVPPASAPVRANPGAVTLRAGPHSAMMRSLHVVRIIPVEQLRARPTILLGRTPVNLSPVLNNPRSLPQIAGRVRAAPDLAEVVADDTSVTEVDQGLIVRSYMTYRIKPGTCAAAASRTRLARTGLSCATYLPASARAAAFANPRDPHYVADPVQRAKALASANEKGAITDGELTKQVGAIRGQLADPAQRGAFEADLGPGSAERIAAMSDDEIKGEIVNSGETSLEQTLFVPSQSRVDPQFRNKFNFVNAPPPPAPPTEVVKPDVNASTPIDEHIYVTGFTLGNDYEWKQRIEKTIKMCLIGCKHTYYAEVYAGFNYGFGLRFPLKVSGTYTYHRDGANPSSESARLTTNFTPINGSADQYAEAGLASTKLFGGKEFVAQFGGHAGAGYDLPFIPNNSVDIAAEYDFTKQLDGDFYNGQFTPPTPGSGTGPSMNKFFTDVDLIGGAANFGILGAKVFPAAQVTLTSDSLTFTVHDFQTGKDTVLDGSGQTIDLGIRPKDHSSYFSIGEPKYTLSLLVTPGIDARLFVDIAVWSHNWDFPVWFPQLAVKIPADGATFGCHEGTICTRGYEYSPTGAKEVSASEAALDTELSRWGDGFDARWMDECADETCRFGIKFIRQGYIYGARHKQDANPALTVQSPEIAGYLKGADGEAKTMINEAQARQTTSAAKSFGTFWIAWWSKQCSDKICMDKVKGISFLAQLEAVSLQKQHEDWSTNEVIGIVGKKFAPVFEFEVKASKDRVAAEEAAQAARQAKQIKPVRIRVRGQT